MVATQRKLSLFTLKRLKPIREGLVGHTGLNNFAVVFANSTKTPPKIRTTQPCYASIQDIGKVRGNPIKYFVDWPFSRHPEDFTPKELAYMRFIVKSSAWAPVFLTKDVNEFKRLGLVLSAKFPARFVIQAAILIRYLGEYPEIIEYWHLFKKHCRADFALILAHCVSSIDRDEKWFTLYSEYQRGHRALTLFEIGRKGSKRILDKDLSLLDEMEPLSTSTWYTHMARCWKTDVGTPPNLIFPEGKPRTERIWGRDRTSYVWTFKDIPELIELIFRKNRMVRYGKKKA